MLVYFLWGAALPFEFLGKLQKAVNLKNKIELGSEDETNVLLSTGGSSACHCVSQAGVKHQQDSMLCKLRGAQQLTQERWAPASAGQRGHHCLWTKLKLMTGQSLGLRGRVWRPWDNRRKTRPSLMTHSHQPHLVSRCSRGYRQFLRSPRLCSNIKWQAFVAPRS